MRSILWILSFILAGSFASSGVRAETYAERLGWEAGDRVLIIHSDDVGMSYASNQGTQAALATCLPPADPLRIDPVPPPLLDVGFQLASTPRFLQKEKESEVCYSTYYDLTGLVPRTDRHRE